MRDAAGGMMSDTHEGVGPTKVEEYFGLGGGEGRDLPRRRKGREAEEENDNALVLSYGVAQL